MSRVGLALDTVFGTLELRPPQSASDVNRVPLIRCRDTIAKALGFHLKYGNIYDARILASHVCALPIGASEEEVAEGLLGALDHGHLIAAAAGDAHSDDHGKELWAAYVTFRARLGREFVVAARRHRLVQREQVETIRSENDYDVVRATEAAGIIKRVAQSAGGGPWQKAAEVIAKHLADLHMPPAPGSFVLLRAPASQAERITPPEDVITPAKLKELVSRRLRDPRWLGAQPVATREQPISSASIDDEVFVRVTTSQFPIGTSITFVIMDAATREVVTTLAGTVGDGESETMAHGRWIVPEMLESGPVVPDKTKFLIAAEAMGQKVDGAELKIVPWVWELLVQFDPDDPKTADDELILLDSGHAEVERVGPGQMSKEGKDWMRVKFKKARKMQKYTLIRDHGEDEGGGIDLLLQDESPFELEKLADEQKAGA
ncbi:MAG: hypothetical protein SF187_17505 [Deltaproteobacteria bacterium]|nr:hypothetical protein [Deltaproteobacteria bacterium]